MSADKEESKVISGTESPLQIVKFCGPDVPILPSRVKSPAGCISHE